METVLIVDDVESVRKTAAAWLAESGLGCTVLVAADSHSALEQADHHTIDLAVLDWNLEDGSTGLQLLKELAAFNPEVVAILMTGFANPTTPIDALRMGVRDYLEKKPDTFNRGTFVSAVRQQLERIRPAKRQRLLNQSLADFRASVEKVLPLVQSAAALNDPVPLPRAIASLFEFLLRTTHAADGVLLVRHLGSDSETYRAFSRDGEPVSGPLVPFARSLAATVVSLQEPSVMNQLDAPGAAPVELQSFEKGRSSLLAAPMPVGPGTHVVLELFDKRPQGQGFNEEDRRVVAAAADFGTELLRQAMAERQTQRMLFDAVEAALRTSDTMAHHLRSAAEAARPEAPPAEAVLEKLRSAFDSGGGAAAVDGDAGVRLAEAVRALAVRHGPSAVRHCIQLVESLHGLLDELTGMEG